MKLTNTKTVIVITIFIFIFAITYNVFVNRNRLPEPNQTNNTNIENDVEGEGNVFELDSQAPSIFPIMMDNYTINAPKYNTVVVNYNDQEGLEKAMSAVQELKIIQNGFEVEYVSSIDNNVADLFIEQLPIENENYLIYYSAKTEKIIIEYFDEQYIEEINALLKDNNVDNASFSIVYSEQ